MRRILKSVAIGLLVTFILIQFIRPARNQSTDVLASDITRIVAIPPDVQILLRASCYDCHSNNTQYPWYMNIQPAAWFMAHHVDEGKRELNFSEFGSYSPRKQIGKMKSIGRQVKKGEMPISSYTLLHADAKLNQEQQELAIAWTQNSADSLSKIEESKN